MFDCHQQDVDTNAAHNYITKSAPKHHLFHFGSVHHTLALMHLHEYVKPSEELLKTDDSITICIQLLDTFVNKGSVFRSKARKLHNICIELIFGNFTIII